jgi:superfamily II DNA or RNA helicase
MNFDTFKPGSLVTLRDRPWIVMPSDDKNLFLVKPLGGTEEETTGIYIPLANQTDLPYSFNFKKPDKADLGDFYSAKLLYNAARLSFRQAAGPFRCLGKLSFRPRSYQMVPLIMALKLPTIRLLIADDVGVGKTVEALLIAKELFERREIKRFAIVCLPHLCDQWQEELKSKFGIEAVIIRSGTVTQLERKIRADENIFRAFPFQIISIDYIKSGNKRQVFVDHCPELIIVDEAHTCARPMGANDTQQLRFRLLNEIATKQNQHLVLITATPHSGKQEEFQSLLSLLKKEYETLDVSSSSQEERKELSKNFIQRRRADVIQWLKDEPQFPERISHDIPFPISKPYGDLLNKVLDYTTNNILVYKGDKRKERYSYWEALALLRGLMSSPLAGATMLRKKAEKKKITDEEDDYPSSTELSGQTILDAESEGDDNLPLGVMQAPEHKGKSETQSLISFAAELEALSGIEKDNKAKEALATIKDWLKDDFSPVVFCRYIPTAHYFGKICKEYFTGRAYKDVIIEVITSELNDELRREKISSMNQPDKKRLLIATDCLSEGINLQEGFNAVLHYDLPWNPNRLEQREGRVDRFGQRKSEVHTGRLYGSNNPVDGLVLDVLIKKSDAIRKTTGISVPLPEDNTSVMSALLEGLLFKENFRIKQDIQQGSLFDEEQLKQITVVHQNIEAAAEREKVSRSIFAQNAIKADKVEKDLAEVDEAIGDVVAVEQFVTEAIKFLSADITPFKEGYKLFTTNIPQRLRELLPKGNEILVSFKSPTPLGYNYIGRNHLFVEHLCQLILNDAISNKGNHAARTAVIKTNEIKEKTVLFQFRVRNVIAELPQNKEIVAEEMWMWGYSGDLKDNKYLEHEDAKALLMNTKATANMELPEQEYWLDEELPWIKDEKKFRSITDTYALKRADHLVNAHLRFRELISGSKFKVVEPILPMDVLGIYILTPENN